MPAGFLIHPGLTSSPSSPQQTAPSAPLAFQRQTPKSSPAPALACLPPPTPDPGSLAALPGCPRAGLPRPKRPVSVLASLAERGQTGCRAKCALSAPQLETGRARRSSATGSTVRALLCICMHVCVRVLCVWMCVGVHASACMRVCARACPCARAPSLTKVLELTPSTQSGGSKRPAAGGG